jgi:hypothetical protein
MICVTPGTGIFLHSITEPKLSVSATMLSHQGRYAELAVEHENPLSPGSLVQFETPSTLYLGEIESKTKEEHLRILIDHSIDRERATAIRRLWNTDQADCSD